MPAGRMPRRRSRKTSRVRATRGGFVKARNRGVANAREWKPAENLPRAIDALRGAARVLLTEQSRRSLVVWITDFSETPTTPEVIEYAMQMTHRHLVVFCAINQPDLTALAETTPQTAQEMYRHAAALEIAQRRDVLLRGLRQRGVFAFELVPGLLASSLVNQYLDIKERNLL